MEDLGGRDRELVGDRLRVGVRVFVAAPHEQAVEQTARAPGATVAHGDVVESVADPALVGRPRGAQLAHGAPLTGVQEHVGVLAAQQRAPADIAGNSLRSGANDLRRHANERSNERF